MSPASLALLRFIPLPNLDGTSRNFHYVDDQRVAHRQRQPARDAQLHAERRARRAVAGAAAAAGGRGGFGGAGGRTRTRAAGHQRQHDGAAAVPPQRQRSDQRLPDARRDAPRARALAVPVSLNIQHKRTTAQRHGQLLAHGIGPAQPVRVRRRRRGRRRDRRRLDRSVRLGRAAAVVLQPSERARRDAVAPHRPAAHARLRLDAPVGRSTRCAPAAMSASIASTARPTPTRDGAFVFTGLVFLRRRADVRGGGLDFADFLLGLPQQATRAVRPGQRAHVADKSLSAVLAGRLAQEQRRSRSISACATS